ncbi:chaplin family protein [Streptomyces lavendofoliae]|uniref:chaplin family protein n=1 Tax=Streptomyces lavendofoliae TaxID=67314 RepID=UPI003D940064
MGAGAKDRNARRQAVLVGVGLGAVALSAAPAHASVIGVGNATFGNVCANAGGAHASGATVSGGGVLAGLVGQLPMDLPRNDCGNSGLTCIPIAGLL